MAIFKLARRCEQAVGFPLADLRRLGRLYKPGLTAAAEIACGIAPVLRTIAHRIKQRPGDCMNSKQTEPSADRSQLEQAYSLMMDTEIRGMFRVDPMAAAKELKARGQPILDLHGVEEIKVVTATRGKMYVPLPRIDGDYLLSDDQLDQITAAGSASTVMCASTAGTLSSVTSTAATFSSAGCAGTAGTAT